MAAASQNYKLSETYFHQALTLNPDSELVIMDLALLRELEDKPQDAIDLYRKVLAADPGNDTARKRSGGTLRRTEEI